MDLTIDSKLKMNHGGMIPVIGYGTYCSPPKDRVLNALPIALNEGFRLIDTAMNYQNEHFIGQILKKTLDENLISRENLFITTKVWKTAMRLNAVREAVEESLENLNIEYLDLLLIHRPLTDFNVATWNVMEDLFNEGIVKAIGVSNFIIKHLEQIKENSTKVPAVNQIEFHPYFNRKGLYNYCNENEILIESYSPLVLGEKFDDSKLKKISIKYKKTPAQILLRWNIQKGCIPIPRSMSADHIKENIQIFDFTIDDFDMKEMETWNEDYMAIKPDPDEPDVR